jgi:hypothetical protein
MHLYEMRATSGSGGSGHGPQHLRAFRRLGPCPPGATQCLLLGLRQWPDSVASDPWLAAGDHLPYLEVQDALGRGAWAPSPAPSRHPTVLLVFVLDEGGRAVAEGQGARIAEPVLQESPGLEVPG